MTQEQFSELVRESVAARSNVEEVDILETGVMKVFMKDGTKFVVAVREVRRSER